MKHLIFLRAAAALFLLLMSSFAAEPSLVVKDGETIAFLGDSITEAGARKNGYVTLVMDALQQQGLSVKSVPAGISGHRSPDMLARLERDVLSKKPQWLVLSCGVNDVWHFQLVLNGRKFQGVPLDDFKKNITSIIDQAQAAGIKVMVLTATMIGEDPERELNKNLIPYNDFLRTIAKEKQCRLADLNQLMQEELKKIPDVKGRAVMFCEPNYQRDIKNKLTTDGCHMNPLGNAMMAKGVLRAFGMSEDAIAAAQKSRVAKP